MPRLTDTPLFHAIRRLVVASGAFAAMASAATAAADSAEAPAMQSPVGTGDIASVGLSLLLVLGAVLLCGWLYSRSQGLRGQTGGVFNIVASQPLGPRERIVVIEIAGKQLIVAMTASQISTLHVFDEPVVQRQGGANGYSDSVFAGRFRSILRGRK